ncbi:MAG: hypothetical protein EOO52_13240 [Gammaproteobacteria bacterium]|nr:MAG: hypothetical protein EOO52_13240 [Gammaproteobacteria bacterium]
MRNLINASVESLISAGSSEYVERSRVAHEMKDSVLDGMKAMADDKENRSYLAMVQALFESGYLAKTERCFNLDQLWSYIYGVKVHEALFPIQNVFKVLQNRGNVNHEESPYNTSGDNYFSALKFQIKPDADDLKVREICSKLGNFENVAPWPTDVFRKVLLIEKQSPFYAVVVEYSIFSKEPTHVHLVRLKENYNDPDVIQELIKIEFNLSSDSEYSPFESDSKVCKIITTLDVVNMSCKPVFAPHLIESILFSIYSCNDCLSIEPQPTAFVD